VSFINSVPGTHSRAIKFALVFVSVTVLLSLLYAVQHYAGGPIRLAIVSRIQDLALSPDNSLIAASANDGRVYLWNAQEGWTRTSLRGHRRSVVGVAFTPDSRTMISAGADGEIRMWDVGTREVRKTIDAGTQLNDLSLSSDGSVAGAVGEDGTVHIVDIASGTLVQSLPQDADARLAIALN